MRQPLRTLVSVLLLPLLAAIAVGSCGENTTQPPDGEQQGDPEADASEVACEWIDLGSTSALPATRVALGVVPDSFASPTWVQVRAPEGDTTAGHTWLEPDDDAGSVMVAPVHPLGDPEGGDVELTVTDGTNACAPVSFTVEALPEAPGTLAALVDSLEALVAVRAELLGTTAEALATASFDTLAQEFIPVAMTQALVSHPDNPNSLAAIAAGTSAEFGDFDMKMADRLLAYSGFPDAMAGYLAGLRAKAAAVPAASLDGAPIAAQSDNPQDYNCIGITTAFELDFCMDEAVEAARTLDGATGTLMNDMGSLAGVAGLVPHAGVQAGAAMVGGGVWAAQTLLGAYAGLLPSILEEITFELTKESFKEDEDGSGQWQNAMVTASSTGWGADKAILEAILQAAGLTDALGPLVRKLDDAPQLDLEALVGYIQSDRVTAIIDAATAGQDFIQWDQETYGPVPVDDDEWTDSKVDALGVLELIDRSTYEPRKPGTGYVILTNDPGTFGDQNVDTQESVEVGEISIDIQPAATQADPSENVPFLVVVENAAHPEALEVTANLGQINAVTYEENGVHTVDYTAPAQADFHDFLTAVDTATTGTLGHTGDSPLDQADITSNVELIVDPIADCIEVGDDRTFTATVVGLEDTSVSWEVKQGPGTIDSTGTYTATEPGSAILLATAVADTTLKGGAQVTVGGCDCWWSVQVTGIPTFGSATLDESWGVGYGISDGKLTGVIGDGANAAGDFLSFTIQLGAPPLGGVTLGPGIHEALGVHGSRISGNALTHQFFSDEDLPPITLTIVHADSNLVEGHASGPVLVSVPPFGEDDTSTGTFRTAFKITPNATAPVADGVTTFICQWPWD